jgi:hypothetical protein
MLPDDVDWLVIQLSAPFPPSQRSAFIAAARSALAGVSALGPGSAYRCLAELQKNFFTPPPDCEAARPRGRYSTRRPSKLVDGLPPVGADDPRTGGRDRRRLRLVG